MPTIPIAGFRQRPQWLVVAALLVAGQAGLALPLFGPERTFATLNDSRPILDGRHPLHLYHGWLGAGTFRDCLAVTCYDPNFQAGYPKTPVFDSGSRPAEAFLYLAPGGAFNPSAYKWGLFITCALVPLVFVAAARNFGLRPAGAVMAGALGVLIWWTPPVQAMLKAGQLDALLAGLTAISFLGGLARYAVDAGPTAWLTMALASVVGWYVHPVAWLGTVPVLAIYYVVNAPRHGLAWHLGFFAILPVGLAPNLSWITDWGRFWWLRQPFHESAPWPAWRELVGLPEQYLHLFGPGTFDSSLALLGLLGLGWMVRQNRTGNAILLISAVFSAAVAARIGSIWLPAKAVSLDRATMLLPALAAIPAAYLVSELLKRWYLGMIFAIVAAAVPISMAFFPERVPAEWNATVEPFQMGLAPGQERLVQMLKHRTGPAARILIEDGDPTKPGWNWTALLPGLTDRAYLGGLDPEGGIEHLACGMKDGRLLNRPLEEWSPEERVAFCDRYNVGWVICRSEAAVQFWTAEPMAREIGRFDDSGEVVAYELERTHSFVRSGKAIVERADRERIVLRDVVPDETGCVRLSFHFQGELRASPLIVTVEADPDSSDPIPLLKLRLPGPVSRVTLQWQHP